MIKAIQYYTAVLAFAVTYNLKFFTHKQKQKTIALYEGTKVIETIDWGNDSGIHDTPNYFSIDKGEGDE